MTDNVQSVGLPDERPPANTVGPIAWLRSNLFNTWYNAILTILVLALLVSAIPPFVGWLLVNAHGFDSNSTVCRQDAGGACWGFIGEKLRFIMFGMFPWDEQWRPLLTIGVFIALAGGVIVLYASRFFGVPMTDNLFSRFGLIMLIGLVAKNGILIVEFANQLQVRDGLDGATAAREAAILRFRPILMTSISTVLGAVPIAFASGAGAETRNPLGLAIVGGLTLSTAMTLYVVPIVYVLMDRLCLAATGRSSAAGLKRAEEIREQVAGFPTGGVPAASAART